MNCSGSCEELIKLTLSYGLLWDWTLSWQRMCLSCETASLQVSSTIIMHCKFNLKRQIFHKNNAQPGEFISQMYRTNLIPSLPMSCHSLKIKSNKSNKIIQYITFAGALTFSSEIFWNNKVSEERVSVCVQISHQETGRQGEKLSHGTDALRTGPCFFFQTAIKHLQRSSGPWSEPH